MGARDTALKVLIACRTRDGWSDELLREQLYWDALDSREASLATRLCYGVQQNRLLLDYYLDRLLQKPKDLQPVVRDILRLGAFQILMLSKVPDSAAVNEAVNQARRSANPKAAGLVNGVLRNLVRQKDSIPPPERLSTRYSCPEPLTELLSHAVGEEQLEALLQAQNEAPAVALQTNTLKITTEELLSLLQNQGASVSCHPFCPDCLVLESGNPASLPAFREGLFYVQDPASKLSVLSAGLQPGMQVLDCCAAPGGKSMAAALAMQNVGTLLSGDLHENKIRKIRETAGRLGVTILTAMARDASTPMPEWEHRFDCVICDVPCSGLGVIRKKPDIRYKDLSQISGLPAVQKKILETSAAFVKPGGLLLYSTCTILPEENHFVTQDFLDHHPEYSPESWTLPVPSDDVGEVTLLPHIHGTDGFYFRLMRREK